jgi:hypothetical protein
MTLLSVDVERVRQACKLWNCLWMSAVMVLVAVILLHIQGRCCCCCCCIYPLSLIYCTLLGGHLSVKKVYTAMSLLNITRHPPSRTAAAEAANSLDRITSYLMLPELRPLEIHDTLRHLNSRWIL